jgi:hypothetical protein
MRAAALAATLGAFVGLTSLPALATDWTIEVNVSDSTPPACTDPDTAPIWIPDTVVSYTFGNDVDLFSSPGLVLFSVGLGLTPGWDNCNSVAIAPSGEVEASVTGLDSQLSLQDLDCPAISPCDAGLLYMNNNAIAGSVDASGVSTTGTKSGTLTVVWTPAG